MTYINKKSLLSTKFNNSGLGMTLEKDIEETNNYYLINNIAVVYKKPTPIQVVKVNYPSRNKAKIVEAYYKTPSTTDFNGIYKNRYIDFDVKETNSKTSFPLSNIHDHQFNHLININNHGGIAFLIVNFKQYNKYFYAPINFIESFWVNKDKGRKSITYQSFLDNCYEIKLGYHPRLDYLKVIDKIII